MRQPGEQLQAAAREVNRAGLAYVVKPNGTIEEITIEVYCSTPGYRRWRHCDVSLTRERAELVAAKIKAKRAGGQS